MGRSSGRHHVPGAAADALERLTAVSHELASAFRPVTLLDVVVRAVNEVLAPDQLAVVLLDTQTNRLTVTHAQGHFALTPDDPLLQLALRQGPLALGGDVGAEARARGAVMAAVGIQSWMGAPLVAAGRTVGAITAGAERPEAFRPADYAFFRALVAKAAIALANSRLVELLSAGKREWELTADSISQAICIVDADGTVRRANRVFAELTDVPVTAVPGRPWLSLVPPAWAETVARALASPGAPPAELRSGDRVYVVTAVRMAAADAGASVLLFEDQTEKRRLQDQLIQSEKMSAIGQLIAGIAHDLNNPLASVVGFSDFLAEAGEIPPHLAEPLAVIRQEAERAATIVRNLLSFARRQEVARRRESVRALLESVLALLRNQLMALHVEAALDVAPDLPSIEANANQLKQVFVNLIVNAAQAIAATGRPGHVQVTARPWLDGVAVSVTDDGPGIPVELRERVFEPFFTTKPEGAGTGLGLSISHGIVREHGGRISLDSGPGQGATFTVELPAAGQGAAAAGPPEAATTPEPLHLLVVDDEPHILHYMRATLESWGHHVSVADDGAAALERALAEPFDAIVCDLRMPTLGGREMYDTLAGRRPDVAAKVIFATGDTVRGDTLQFLESLGRPFLHKPFTLAELRTVLGAVRRAG